MARARTNPAPMPYALGALALLATGGVVYWATHARTLAASRAAQEAKRLKAEGFASRRAEKRAEEDASRPVGLTFGVRRSEDV